MRSLYIVILGAFFLCACSDNVIVDESRTFANGVWNRFTPEEFTIDVTNADDYYNINLEIVIDSALMRDHQMPFTVNLYSPEGERRMFYAYIPLVENGRWKGQPQPGRQRDGLRVINQCIRPFFTFNSEGTYRMEVGQATSQYDLEGVESLRLTVEKTTIDYKELSE